LLSQSEAKEVINELWPALARNRKNCDTVLRMAYSASADDGDGGTGDGLIDRGEFPMMLEYVQYFNKMYFSFKEIDQSGDGMIDEEEFVRKYTSNPSWINPIGLIKHHNVLDIL
jgi:hypothetical protein